MTIVRFLTGDDVVSEIDLPTGVSVMRAAVTAGVPGIVGECGGQAMCATCHVYVVAPPMGSLPEVSEDEDEMLDSTAAPREPESRLSCQLKDIACDEVVLRLPERQL